MSWSRHSRISATPSRCPEASQLNALIPFRRDKKRDFATGEVLLASQVRQVLLTEGAAAHSSGELPWRTSFGCGLALLRHRGNDVALKELARVHIRDALRRWLPGVQLVGVEAIAEDESLTLRVRVKEFGVITSLDVPVELKLGG